MVAQRSSAMAPEHGAAAEERHRLRIALKKLRYTVEFFTPLYAAKAVSAFLLRLSKLQDLFSALNDAATAEHILRRVSDRAAAHAGAVARGDVRALGDTQLLEAATFVDGWHRSRIEPTLGQRQEALETVF